MTDTRWQKAIQYRHTCEGACGERKICAVIHRRGKRTLRLCLDCYRDGFWKGQP